VNDLGCAACENLIAKRYSQDLPVNLDNALNRHLQICPSCSSYERTLAQTRQLLRAEMPLPSAPVQRRLRSPLADLQHRPVPLYQATLGAVAVVLVLIIVDAPTPYPTARATVAPHGDYYSTTARPDSYEVMANLRLLDNRERGLADDSLMIHFPTKVNSI
jgi:hypothetical protein